MTKMTLDIHTSRACNNDGWAYAVTLLPELKLQQDTSLPRQRSKLCCACATASLHMHQQLAPHNLKKKT
jgi:hypothetical protein